MKNKIKTREELREIVKELHRAGKKAVHTNGCYDLLHSGHIQTLQKAKEMGDALIVSINSDESIKKFKGQNRPIFNEEERSALLSALEYVDYVTVFPEDDILKTLEIIRPDYHVKGGTFIPERVKKEKDLVESWGGEFKSLPLIEGKSTTNIIQKIMEKEKENKKASRYELFDRNKLEIKSVNLRESKSNVSIMANPDLNLPQLSMEEKKNVERVAKYMKESREKGASIIIAYGAHLFKNGCSPLLIKLMEKGYVQQLLTSGAGLIHDFEIAFMGKTEEDVRKYVKEGQFGLWEETGKYINKCINLASETGKGMGEAVGEMIATGKLGDEKIDFPYKKYSIVAKAYELGIPLSSCIGIGYDIIHTHPLCNGAALGNTSYTDFLIFANSVSKLEKGMMISIGSAIMAPMVFEKSLSMANNLARQNNVKLDNFRIVVNDIQPGEWDWHLGEPPKDNPAYYLRFCKSFARMGKDFEYVRMDNRKFLGGLYDSLK